MNIYSDFVFYDKLISPVNGYECRIINIKNIKFFGYDTIEFLHDQYPNFPTQCEEYKDKLRAANKRNSHIYKTEEYRAKQSKNVSAYFSKQENRDAHSKKMKMAVINNPDSYSKNNVSGRAKLYEYNGMTFKGTWELIFAKWLDENCINFIQPEPVSYLDGTGRERLYFPDFYLTDYELYNEVKGYERELDRIKWNSLDKIRVIRSKDISMIKKGTFTISDLISY